MEWSPRRILNALADGWSGQARRERGKIDLNRRR